MPDSPPGGVAALLAELKRRRVVRVSIAYLVVAWVAIEVADTVFPNLGLPDWSVRAVIVAAGLGLIPAIVLSWIFDITETGIERTPASPRTSARPVRHRQLAAAALVVVALTAGGWVAVTKLTNDAALVDGRITVLPFRVTATDPSLEHLREGLPTLLENALGSYADISVVPARTVLAALDRRGARDADLLDDVSADVARELGSRNVLLADLVEYGNEVRITGAIMDAGSSSPRFQISVSAPADSLHTLVDRLANQIVAGMGGTPQHRLSAVTTTSLPALGAYMHGMADFRVGRYDSAAARFDQAVTLDSTFALAAFWLNAAGVWTADRPPNYARAIRLASRYKDQLSTADRTLLDAVLGPRDENGALSGWGALVAVRERAARLHPQSAELAYHFGDALLHYGSLIGQRDYLERAQENFARAIAIDSTYVEPLEHAAAVAHMLGDSASYERYSRLLTAVDSLSETALTHRWTRRYVVGDMDAPSTEEVFSRLGPAAALELYWKASTQGIGVVELANVLDTISVLYQPSGAAHNSAAVYLALLEGRLHRLDTIADLDGWSEGDRAWSLLWNSLTQTQDGAAAAAAARRLLALPDFRLVGSNGCLLGIWAARTGQQDILDRIRGDMDRDTVRTATRASTHLLCQRLFDAILEQRNGGGRTDALRTLDAQLRSATPPAWLTLELVNVEAARLWEAHGELERSLNALLRIEGQFPGALWADRLAEAGRLAERLGDRRTAIDCYTRHLRLRSRPDHPVLIERTRIVRDRLAALQEST